GVVLEKALATSSWTLPSHASMFTGRFRHELPIDRVKPVRLTYPTLAEVLGEHGYRTGGFVANLNYCTEERGLSRGFMHYEDYPVSLGQIILTSSLGRAITNSSLFRRALNYHDMLNDKNAERVNADFLRWIEQDNGTPFFAFLNYYDAHEPYLPPEGFDVMFGPDQPRGEFTYRTNDIERSEKWRMSPEEIEVERSAYDGSIAYLDQQISRLIDELENRGVLQNTLVIITSDHGEQFGERNKLFGHGNSLYFSSIHVPLLLFFPSKVPSGLRIPDPVSIRDIPSTVVDLIGLGSEGIFPGESLTRYWNGREEHRLAIDSPVLSELSGGFGEQWFPIAKGDLKSLVLGRYHYIRNGDGSEELYDFKKDPLEQIDLAGSEEGRSLLGQFRMNLEFILAGSEVEE
ncbi:MAG TPA: sulfatase, partial [Blastocatellia bacterium]|nr:sulfatase [Blastocatellia bacterium]